MEQSNHTIRMLVEGSAKNDAESCKKLYEHVVDSVFAYVRYRTGTKEQATDITQDVFIDFFSTLSNFTYKSRAQFYSYLFVITRRKIAQHYAAANMHGKNETMEFDEGTMSASSFDAETQQTNTFDVQRALSSLDDLSREIVVLHHWSRHTFPEIALLLEMQESAVRVRHHRALKVLAQELNEVVI